jgi:hypothetical protein
MPTAVRHSTYPTAQTYGADRYYLEATLVGQGASAPIIQAPSINGAPGTAPPGSAEILTITRTSAGLYPITLADSYFAVIYASADLDDTAGIGAYATIGSWTNLNTANPAGFTLITWNASGAAKTDAPSNTLIRIAIAFKKNWTGASA